MKKTLLFAMVLMLAFAVVTPAAAQGIADGRGPGYGNGAGAGAAAGSGLAAGLGQAGGQSRFALTGTLAAIGTDTVTINVLHGNRLAQPYLGKPVTLTLTANTLYLLRDGTTATPITLSALKVGDPISANGTLVNGIWTTLRITVGASLSCLP